MAERGSDIFYVSVHSRRISRTSDEKVLLKDPHFYGKPASSYDEGQTKNDREAAF